MSANPCKITGCGLVAAHSELWVHGDLYEYGNCWVFVAVTGEGNLPAWYRPEHKLRPPEKKFLVVLGDNYFERKGVFVVPKVQANLSPEAEAYIAKWG